jgi:hypothetical protein
MSGCPVSEIVAPLEIVVTVGAGSVAVAEGGELTLKIFV